MARSEGRRIAILGAGPIGLEAGIYAHRLNLPFRIYERGRVGEHLLQWGHVRMFTPFGLNSTTLGCAALRADQPRVPLPGENDLLSGQDFVAKYLEPLALSSPLAESIQTDSRVIQIGRTNLLKEQLYGDSRRGQHPFRLLISNAAGEERVEEADIVLDCTGTYANPRYLGNGGIPAIGELGVRKQIYWGIEDITGQAKARFADRTVLVVGSGYSAATNICHLAKLAEKHPTTWIFWLARATGSQPIRRHMSDPLRERDLLAAKANMLATRGEGNVEFFPGSRVEMIERTKEGFTVLAQVGSEERAWDVDSIIANVGYEPDTSIYRELQVQQCNVTLASGKVGANFLNPPGPEHFVTSSTGPASLKHPEPNFYILGSKTYGRKPTFLLRTGHEQIREVYSLIMNKTDLDLYRKKG